MGGGGRGISRHGAYVTVNWLRVLSLSILTSEYRRWHSTIYSFGWTHTVVVPLTTNYNLIGKEQKLISLFIEFAWQPSKLLNINFQAYPIALCAVSICLFPLIANYWIVFLAGNSSLIYRTCWPFSGSPQVCNEIIKTLGPSKNKEKNRRKDIKIGTSWLTVAPADEAPQIE